MKLELDKNKSKIDKNYNYFSEDELTLHEKNKVIKRLKIVFQEKIINLI